MPENCTFSWVFLAIVVLVLAGVGTVGYLILQHHYNSEPLNDIAEGVDTVQSDIETERQDSTNNSPPLRYPSVVGANYKFDNYTDLGEEIAMRRFSIPTGAVGSIELFTAYQSYFSNTNRHRDKIVTLADTNAAFSDIFQHEFGSSAHWQSITAHVGEFSQDNCGDITIVYTLENSAVTAVFIDNLKVESILSDSQCPLNPEQLLDKDENKPDEIGLIFGRFCRERASCLQNYFVNPDNKKKLQSEWLNVVRDLRVE